MDTNFKNIEAQVIEKLKVFAPNMKCPICSTSDFILGGGYFAHDIQKDLQSRQIGGQNVPTIPIICKKCGYLMEFSAGLLGLLPKEEPGEKHA